MRHYMLVVEMEGRHSWEMPLGRQPSIEAAIMRALYLGDMLRWGRVELGFPGGIPIKITNYSEVEAFFENPMAAVDFLYRNAPDFTHVREFAGVRIVEGKVGEAHE